VISFGGYAVKDKPDNPKAGQLPIKPSPGLQGEWLFFFIGGCAVVLVVE
jgi:hypothetical protein